MCKTIAVFQGDEARSGQLAIFPEDRIAPQLECEVVCPPESASAWNAPDVSCTMALGFMCHRDEASDCSSLLSPTHEGDRS